MRKLNCLPVLSAFAAALVLCCSVASLAQNPRRYVISAKAGAVNAITGQATVHGKGESDWQELMITDDLNSGDRVRTAYDGRVEILLNPGSFLRVASNSEIEMSNNSLENIEVRLVKGTAIVEATGYDGVELNINIATPHTKIAIVRQGLYRLSVVPGNATELIVRKGHVILSDNSHTKVKGGNRVVFSQANVSVAKLTKEDKKNEESVDTWSKERAEALARANRRTSLRMLDSAFASARDPFGDRGFTRGFGFWYFNANIGCYTFVPWFYGWRSPYGSYYTTGVYNPYAGQSYSGGNRNGSSSNPPAGGGGGTYPSGGGSAGNGGVRPVAPPSSSGGGFGNGGGNNNPMPSRPIESDTGRPMPRKSLEVNRP